MEVFFLAFANDENNILPNLKDEAETVYEYCFSKSTNNNFLAFWQPYTTIDKISNKLQDFDREVTLFLYSGHANGTGLLMEGKEAGTNGIAMLLKNSVQSGKLKLVILNGCATAPAVKKFLEMGVPAVIATQASVDDKAACEFSKALFKGLCEKEKTIYEAFSTALGVAAVTNNKLESSAAIRHLQYLDDITVTGKPLWELFTLEGNEDLAKRKIIPPSRESDFKFRSSNKLLKAIATAFYNAGNKIVIDVWNRETSKGGEAMDESLIAEAVLNSIPRPIGLELERLLKLGIHEYGIKDKLQKMHEIFLGVNQFFGIIMISQLWEVILFAIREKIGYSIPVVLQSLLRQYLDLDPSSRQTFDYPTLIIAIKNYLFELKDQSEFADFIDRQKVINDFKMIIDVKYIALSTRISSLTSDIPASLQEGNASELYEQYEACLGNLFSTFSFIHRYKLHSVSMIQAIKDRSDIKANYLHNVRSLQQVYLDSPPSQIMNEIYLDSHCVAIILNDVDMKVLDFLVLSPFIIDRNAFDYEANKVQLSIFGGNLSPGRSVYQDLGEPGDELTLEPSLNEKLIKEIRDFRVNMLQG